VKTEQEYIILVSKAKKGDSRAFQDILKELDIDLKKIASKYYINGADAQDTLQEARIGVWKAVVDWQVDGGMSFKNFAISLCCKRHIITAMSTANRKKYDPLNSAISLSLPLASSEDDNEQYLADFIPDPKLSTLDTYISQEEYDLWCERICSKLTNLEKAIFYEYMFGQSYNEIAEVLGVKSKAVDNALMRIRKKAAEIYEECLEIDKED
jgi:RNA polymerase sporulation-specific sigma factor